MSEDFQTIDVHVLVAFDLMSDRIRAELRVIVNDPFDLVEVAFGPSDLALVGMEVHAES